MTANVTPVCAPCPGCVMCQPRQVPVPPADAPTPAPPPLGAPHETADRTVAPPLVATPVEQPIIAPTTDPAVATATPTRIPKVYAYRMRLADGTYMTVPYTVYE